MNGPVSEALEQDLISWVRKRGVFLGPGLDGEVDESLTRDGFRANLRRKSSQMCLCLGYSRVQEV